MILGGLPFRGPCIVVQPQKEPFDIPEFRKHFLKILLDISLDGNHLIITIYLLLRKT